MKSLVSLMNTTLLGCALLAPLALAGCEDALSRNDSTELREQIIAAHRKELAASANAVTVDLVPSASDSYLDKHPDRIKELDAVSGPDAYKKTQLDPGKPLDGKPVTTVALSLQQAIRLAAQNNVDIGVARIQPGISQAQVASSEAAFDAVFFTDASWNKIDRPQPVRLISQANPNNPATTTLVTVGQPVQVNDAGNLSTGIRKPLETGGTLTISTGFDYLNNKTPDLITSPNPSYTSNLLIDLKQPLLRNFGEYVNHAQININKNAQRRDVLALHNQMLTTISETEQAYWNLVFARESQAIAQNLLDMTLAARKILKDRQDFDVNPIQTAQVQSFVDRRRGDIIRAQRLVRDATDTLKRLINDPSLPISSETLIVPSDAPIEVPLSYNLLDAVTTSLQHRPEVRAAMLGIDDASIRQQVADNQRLPQLNLEAQMAYRGLNNDLGGSYRALGDGDFIEYLVSMQFEAPIGNRAAEADYTRSRLERRQAVGQYQRAVQDVVRDVKQQLRGQQESWQLIGITRAERRATAENLRAINVRENQGEALTPEFLLDLKLTTQQRLADAETREMQAIIDYNVGIIKLRQSMGTLLEHDQIDLAWPDTMFDDAGAPTTAVEKINAKK